MPKTVHYAIDEVLSWVTGKDSLRQTLVDRAEEDMGLTDEEGTIAVTVDGDTCEFICTFTEA